MMYYDWWHGIKVALLTLVLLLGILVVLYASVRFVHMPSPESQRVTIYTTSWCPYCTQLRTRLAHNQISYTEYDVEKSLWGWLGFWFLHGQGVPLGVVGSEVIRGYNAEQWQLALLHLNYPFKPILGNLLDTHSSKKRSSLLPKFSE